MFFITEIKACISDSGEDIVIESPKKDMYKFRLLDDDGEIYFYGYSTDNSSFAPLDNYGVSYGCTSIEYYNPDTDQYEML